MQKTATLLALTAALLLAPVSGAQAASPPKGKYPCFVYISGTGLVGAGTLRIHSKSSYSVNAKKRGTFKTSGKKIRFTTGDYRKLHKGRWYREDGTVKIGLYKKSDTGYKNELITCDRS